ncbi:MAG: sulfatase-like hydrolase/transferase [Fuerstiella sp.]
MGKILVFAGTACANGDDLADPNIILLMADDLGWGDGIYNGHPYLKTPHLDQMSRSGIRFDRFYAASAVCSPTRGSRSNRKNHRREEVSGEEGPVRSEANERIQSGKTELAQIGRQYVTLWNSRTAVMTLLGKKYSMDFNVQE